MKPHYYLLVIALLLAGAGSAQDSLFYTNGTVITGKVEEMGVDLVRYRTGSGGTAVLIVAEKKDLARVKLEGGQEFLINAAYPTSPASNTFLARTRQVAFDFLSPALNHAVVGYEQTFGTRTSLVVKAGYIGVGSYRRNGIGQDRSGALLKVGVNFFLPRGQRRTPALRDQHPLSGWYLRPELSASAWYRQDYYGYYPYPTVGPHSDFTSVALNMVLGRKVIIGERLTFDIFGGLGYGVQWRDGMASISTNTDTYYYRQEYSYSHAFLGNYTALTCTGGMMFGYLF